MLLIYVKKKQYDQLWLLNIKSNQVALNNAQGVMK